MMSTAEHPQWTSLRAALERGLTEQGNRNRIVVSGGDGYVAFSGQAGEDAWLCQVSAGKQLPKEMRLTPEQGQRIADYGLSQLRASANFRKKFQTESEQLDVWCSRALSLMGSVFGVHDVDINIGLNGGRPQPKDVG